MIKNMIKDTDDHPDGRYTQDKVCGKGCRASMSSLGTLFSQQPRRSLNLVPWDFYGSFITQV